MSDLPVEEVAETIPDFHNTPKRYARLMEVIAADPVVEGMTLTNTLAQEQARALLADSDDYF